MLGIELQRICKNQSVKAVFICVWRKSKKTKQVKTFVLGMQTSVIYRKSAPIFSNWFSNSTCQNKSNYLGIMALWIYYSLKNDSPSYLLCKCLSKWETKLFSPRSIMVNSQSALKKFPPNKEVGGMRLRNDRQGECFQGSYLLLLSSTCVLQNTSYIGVSSFLGH